ncbi:MAG: hypothetical protein ABFR62_12105 [Bacteroidota bacterium]
MDRIHLFEFEDQKWFPAFLRNFATDFLQFGANKFDMYKGVIPIIEKGLELSNSEKINDLASGGGGGWLKILEHLKTNHPNVKIILSDLYPNIKSFNHLKVSDSSISYIEKPIDIINVKFPEDSLQTMFLSFHHFKPGNAKQILQNTVNNKTVLAIIEAQDRSFQSLLAMFLSPISLWIMTPMIRPFSFIRIIFTYLIPILPILVWWDGIISSLRTYSENDLKELISQVDDYESYEWEIGKAKSGQIKNTYLLAYPK